jgi:hypothetical protein
MMGASGNGEISLAPIWAGRPDARRLDARLRQPHSLMEGVVTISRFLGHDFRAGDTPAIQRQRSGAFSLLVAVAQDRRLAEDRCGVQSEHAVVEVIRTMNALDLLEPDSDADISK